MLDQYLEMDEEMGLSRHCDECESLGLGFFFGEEEDRKMAIAEFNYECDMYQEPERKICLYQ